MLNFVNKTNSIFRFQLIFTNNLEFVLGCITRKLRSSFNKLQLRKPSFLNKIFYLIIIYLVNVLLYLKLFLLESILY